jgi:hypothetical protein
MHEFNDIKIAQLALKNTKTLLAQHGAHHGDAGRRLSELQLSMWYLWIDSINAMTRGLFRRRISAFIVYAEGMQTPFP